MWQKNRSYKEHHECEEKNSGDLNSGFLPCTPNGCIKLIERTGVKVSFLSHFVSLPNNVWQDRKLSWQLTYNWWHKQWIRKREIQNQWSWQPEQEALAFICWNIREINWEYQQVAGSTAVVLGRSKIVGTPAAGDFYKYDLHDDQLNIWFQNHTSFEPELLKWMHATVTVCHSKWVRITNR